MKLEAEKIDLVRRLLDTDDKTLINQIAALFDKKEKDFWDQLPDHVKQGILKSKDQGKNGILAAHADVMKKHS
ncbi:MAG TPA: hypothetical protein DIT07_00315 [Sphingobacteriaceae bacterium]|nr:hypothetical protein [Sphingobacteriaceae bacterium]